jgi:hypothetical protein
MDQTFGIKQNLNPNLHNPIVRLNSEVDHSPVVRLDMGDDDVGRDDILPESDDKIFMQVKNINLDKRVVAKYVEVTTKIVYKFDDGSTKETIETNNHTFKY